MPEQGSAWSTDRLVGVQEAATKEDECGRGGNQKPVADVVLAELA